MTHPDFAPVPTLGRTREDLRFRGWTFIETKWADLGPDRRIKWTTEIKIFRKEGIEKLWFKGRHRNAELFWVGKIPRVDGPRLDTTGVELEVA